MELNSFGIDQAYMHEFSNYFDVHFEAIGPKILPYLLRDTVIGDAKIYTDSNIGKPQVMVHGGQTNYASQSYSTRVLTPEAFSIALKLEILDKIKSGYRISSDQLAQQASVECGVYLDQMIIRSLTEDVVGTKKSGTNIGNVYAFPKSQIIAFNNNKFIAANETRYSDAVKNGLNLSKLSQARSKIRMANIHDPIILFGTESAMETLYNDEKAANMLYSQNKSLADGAVSMQGFHSIFGLTFEFPTYQTKATGAVAGTDVEYVYAVATNKVVVGVNGELSLQTGTLPDQNFSETLFMYGSYGAIRKHEKGVVVIEVAKSAVI